MGDQILVVLQQESGKVRRVTLEMLSLAQQLRPGRVTALTFGPGAESTQDVLGRYGADRLVVLSQPQFANYSSDGFAKAVQAVQNVVAANAILFPATAWGKDLAPRVAGLLEAGLASDCTEVRPDDQGRCIATRPVYAGKAFATIQIDTPVQLFSIRPNIQPIKETQRAAELFDCPVDIPDTVFQSRVVEVRTQGTETVELTEAEIIVSGGRGMKGPDNFKLLDELASALGAAVGSSRPVADEGWVPHSYHIGQTGKVVSPNVYFAIGISGAIQHLAGISGSKYIVAINSDPEAPIFKAANYGIVGNLFDVVPAVTAAVRQLKSDQ